MSQKADLDATKHLTVACQAYKLANGDWPANLEVLTKDQPNGGKPFLDGTALVPKSAEKFNYDPAGPNNRGIVPDIWVNGPDGKIGNWM